MLVKSGGLRFARGFLLRGSGFLILNLKCMRDSLDGPASSKLSIGKDEWACLIDELPCLHLGEGHTKASRSRSRSLFLF